MKHIAVSSGRGAETGVEGIGHFSRLKHDDPMLRQAVVQDPRQPFRWDEGVCVEMGDLPQSVDASVGSALSEKPQAGRRENLSEVPLQQVLHGAALGLALPATKIGAVVRQVNPYAHGSNPGGVRSKQNAHHRDTERRI